MAHARHVVLAIPFTCCRDILFWPPLPSSARSMISCSVYGAVRKMHFIFDDAVEASTFTVTDTSLGYCGAAQGGGIVSFCGGRPLLA